MYKLNERLREKLKEPLDLLLKGEEEEIIKRIREETRGCRCLILVGDYVSRSVYENGIKANLYVFDNKIERKDVKQIEIETKYTFYLENKQGTINPFAFDLIKKAIELGDSKIIVKGEEDLLVLPSVVVSPINSIVLYGQPKQGVVVVRVNESKKKEIEQIIEEMKSSS
jgi:uncharacterized protein (UPF0218 family)